MRRCAPLRRAAALLGLLGALVPRAAAQSPAGSAAGDTAALLAVAADAGNADARANAFRGWDEGAEPCAAGSWDDDGSGYEGVRCDRAGGRVVCVDRYYQGLGCDAALFAPLGALQWLALEQNAALHGDVASLGGLVELRYLGLCDTAVHGAPASLVGLRHLGEPVTTVPGYSGLTGVLHLARTRVAGPVAALQALPGLGSSWGS